MGTRATLLALVGLVFWSPVLGLTAVAQVADSTVAVELDPIVVTASKVRSALSSSTVGVSVIDAKQLRALPYRGASSLLSYIPGMTFLDFDGLGYAPQSVTRGFYGGGEAEYVVVMVNGRPVNNLENGLVNWEQITLSPNTVVEVLRGGASSLYGDAAIGAVINIRTEAAEETSARLRARTGNLGIRSVSGSVSSPRYSAGADLSTSEGFRDHSQRFSGSLQGSYQLVDEMSKTLSLSAGFNVREYDTPGPLRSTDPAGDGSESLPFFRFDNADETTFRSSLDGGWEMTTGRLDASVTGEFRNHDLVRTLPLSADFADTQERQVDALGLRTNIQFSGLSLPIPIDNKLVFGIDGFAGSLDSRYFHIATGGIDDTYRDASGDPGDVVSDGSASRIGFAGSAFLELNPSSALTLSLGGRFDTIRDSFSEVEGLSSAIPSTTHNAFSPKVGVNYRYTSSATQVGNVYVSASRSFKAPTLDQLYDLRAFPVPFPPFAIQISNSELIPQEGTNLEAGFYHRMAGGHGWSAMLAGSVYTIDMKNELDFSFETFSNINIGESRHRGVETSLTVEKSELGSAFLNCTLQDVTYLNGENVGNRVKAIPLHAFSGGVVAHFEPISSSLVLNGVSDVLVDDANMTALPDYATLDARISYTRKAYRFTLDVHNALDREYNSTAYQDPGGSDVLFIFPAALRTVSVGLELSL